MKGLRKILRVSRTAKVNKWVVGSWQSWGKEGTDRHRQSKEATIQWGNKGVAWRKRQCKEQCQVHAGEEDHARPGWTTLRRGQDSPWKSRSEWQRTGIKWRKYVHCAWPTLGSRTTKDQGPDLQNILRQSYDYLAILPTLRSVYDGRLIYKTSYDYRKINLP